MREWMVVLEKMLRWVISSLLHAFLSSRYLSLGICTFVHPGYHSKGKQVLLLLPGFLLPIWMFQLACMCGYRGAFRSGTIHLLHDKRENDIALQLCLFLQNDSSSIILSSLYYLHYFVFHYIYHYIIIILYYG